VVSEADALGNTTSYTYDARGNKLSENDPLGNTTSYTYDARDNMLTQTGPLGNTTTYTYNSRNQVLSTTDPLGNITTYTYDYENRLIQVTRKSDDSAINYYYDAFGRLIEKQINDDESIIYLWDNFRIIEEIIAVISDVKRLKFVRINHEKRIDQVQVIERAQEQESLPTADEYRLGITKNPARFTSCVVVQGFDLGSDFQPGESLIHALLVKVPPLGG